MHSLPSHLATQVSLSFQPEVASCVTGYSILLERKFLLPQENIGETFKNKLVRNEDANYEEKRIKEFILQKRMLRSEHPSDFLYKESSSLRPRTPSPTIYSRRWGRTRWGRPVGALMFSVETGKVKMGDKDNKGRLPLECTSAIVLSLLLLSDQ